MKNYQQRFNIKGFQEITLIDWDGKIASIIFLSGCNLKCGFCHSSRLVLDTAKDHIPFENIIHFLEGKRGWVDGVVITGGEPTLNEKDIFDIVSGIKDLGLLVKLDTNGTRGQTIKKLIDSKLIDYIAMDIKAPLDEEAYSRACDIKVNIEDIIFSKDIILGSDINYEFRTTVVPGIITLSNIGGIARSLVPAKRYCLQQFVPRDTIDPNFLKVTPYAIKELYNMAAICSDYLSNVIVRRN